MLYSAIPRLTTLPRTMRLAAATVTMLGLLTGCEEDSEIIAPPVAPTAPARISVRQSGLSPEGIQYDQANARFLVSSRTRGRIGAVRDDSTYTVLADDTLLVSTIGLNLDVPRQRLLVAVADNGANTRRTTAATLRKLAALAIFNPTTGARQGYVNLNVGNATNYPNHFANDIAVDNAGNAYVTDSFAPIIYKVDVQGTPTVFLEDPRLSAATGFGLNGIVFHPDGYLLVAKSNDGTLFKVPVSAPTTFTTVASTQGLVGADGLLLLDPQTLLVVSGSQSAVFRLNSTDAWATTRGTGTFATGAVSPTTIARRNTSDAYVLYPYQATAPRFAIVKAVF